MVYLFPYAGDDRRPSVQKSAARRQKAKPKVEKSRVVDEIVTPILNHSSELMPVPMPGSMWTIMKEVCDRHDCKPSELAGNGKEYKLVYARREYCLRVRQETRYSLSHIAKTIKKDHTTVLHAINMASKGPEHYAPFAKKKPPRKAYEPYKIILEREYTVDFSDRDRRVYKYMQEGLNNQEIADAMGVRVRQARDYKYQVNCKLKRIEYLEKVD
jgi:hypothetical protein